MSFRGIGALPFAANATGHNNHNHNNHNLNNPTVAQAAPTTTHQPTRNSQPYPLPERDERSLSAANHLARLQENATLASNYIKEQTKMINKLNTKFQDDYAKYRNQQKEDEDEESDDDSDDDEDKKKKKKPPPAATTKKKKRGRPSKKDLAADAEDEKMKKKTTTTKKKKKKPPVKKNLKKKKKGQIVDLDVLVYKHSLAVNNHIGNLQKATRLMDKIQLDQNQAITSLGASVSKTSYAQRRVQLQNSANENVVASQNASRSVSHHNKWTMETRFIRVYEDMIGEPYHNIKVKEEVESDSTKKKKKAAAAGKKKGQGEDAVKEDDDDDNEESFHDALQDNEDDDDNDNKNKKRKATDQGEEESKEGDGDDGSQPRKKKAAKKSKDGKEPSSSSKKKKAPPPVAAAPPPPKTKQELLAEAPVGAFTMPSDGELYTVREIFPQLLAIVNVGLRHKQWRYLAKYKFVPDIPKSTMHNNFWKPARLGTLDLNRGWKQELGRRPLLTVSEVQDIVNTTPNIKQLLDDPTGIENILIDVRIRKLEADGQVITNREEIRKLYNKQTLHNYKAMFASIIQQEQSSQGTSGTGNNKNAATNAAASAGRGSGAGSGSAIRATQQQPRPTNDMATGMEAITEAATAEIDDHTKRMSEVETILQNGPSGIPLKFSMPKDVMRGYTFGEAIPQLNKIYDNKSRMKMWRYLKEHNLVPNSISDSTFKYLLDLYRQNRIPDMNRPWKLTHSNNTSGGGGGQRHHHNTPKHESNTNNNAYHDPYNNDDDDGHMI